MILDSACPRTDDILNYCLTAQPAIPCILTGNSDELYTAKSKYKSHTFINYFENRDDIESLWQKISHFIGLRSRAQKKKEYCKVNLSFFMSTKQVFCDVYLKVGESKYIKVFNRYDQIDFNDIKKYDRRNIHHLYVRERDFALIMKKLVEQLQPMMDSSNHALVLSNRKLSSMFSIQLQETVSESVQKLGLNNEAIQMTNIAINSTLELIQENDEIFKILSGAIKGENYISEHSFLLSFISCSILKETAHAHPDNALTLSIAAFFHDMGLSDDDMAQVQTTHEYAFKVLGIEDQKEVLSHPKKACELVKKIAGIPANVQGVLMEHHETYDGRGFPAGIDYKRISPLSAIFIVSHELANYFYNSGQSPDNIKDIINDLQLQYLFGNFKMAIQAAAKVFIQTTEIEDRNMKKVV